MGSNINIKHSADISGILYFDDEKILIEVEDVETPINLKDFFDDFNCKNVKISISNKTEI